MDNGWTRSRFDMGRRDGRVVVDPLRASTDRVGVIAFSIADWWLLVSGSDDKPVRIWDVEAHTMLIEPLSFICCAFALLQVCRVLMR